jgi:hypothetical protein
MATSFVRVSQPKRLACEWIPFLVSIPVLGILLFHFSLATSPDNDKCFALKLLVFGDGNADREK